VSFRLGTRVGMERVAYLWRRFYGNQHNTRRVTFLNFNI
jgi:hypothetical protein